MAGSNLRINESDDETTYISDIKTARVTTQSVAALALPFLIVTGLHRELAMTVCRCLAGLRTAVGILAAGPSVKGLVEKVLIRVQANARATLQLHFLGFWTPSVGTFSASNIGGRQPAFATVRVGLAVLAILGLVWRCTGSHVFLEI